MKKKVLLLALVFTLITAISGATYALFSANSGQQTTNITAGTVCLTANRDDGQPIPGPMFFVTTDQGRTTGGVAPLPGSETGVWAPGDDHTRTLIVQNTCSLDAWLRTIKATVTSGDSTLSSALNVHVTASTGGGGPDIDIANGSLTSFLSGSGVTIAPTSGNPRLIAAAPGGLQFLHFNVSMPRSTGNDMQGKTLVVTFQVDAEQNVHNP